MSLDISCEQLISVFLHSYRHILAVIHSRFYSSNTSCFVILERVSSQTYTSSEQYLLRCTVCQL